ncbi:hypothetical protein WN943_015184 [Citrus x changshan-huyou]
MRSTLVLPSLILLFAFIATPLPVNGNASPDPVLDIAGKQLRAGRQWLLTTGGVEGNPGPRTMRNWFKIEKFFGDYKLVYCPSVCNFCRGLCRDVGIFINGGVRRLALSDVPFKVVFKKV